MEKHRNESDEHFDQLEKAFLLALINSVIAFGEQAFYRYFSGSRPNPNGRWNKSVNKSLFECVTWKMAQLETKHVMLAKEALREAFIVLMTDSDRFLENIEYRGGSYHTQQVRRRFKVIGEAFDEVMQHADVHQHPFRLELKKQYLEENKNCFYCKNVIQRLDDAHICNMDKYWLCFIPDGPVRFAHRFCANRFSEDVHA